MQLNPVQLKSLAFIRTHHYKNTHLLPSNDCSPFQSNFFFPKPLRNLLHSHPPPLRHHNSRDGKSNMEDHEVIEQIRRGTFGIVFLLSIKLKNKHTVIDPSMVVNSSTFITFGCSTYQSGGLTKSDRAMDGIIGFGQHASLFLVRLWLQTLFIAPIVPSQAHYNLELQSITVGEQVLSIDASAFAILDIQGTIVDTGTTFCYLTHMNLLLMLDDLYILLPHNHQRWMLFQKGKYIELIAGGGEDGDVECFDMRVRSSISRLNAVTSVTEGG
ncbi:hypothetical protein M8C21_008132 [Ambrosia artemisiifolia]|uniref:Uncharacterized protein n=1 Tax=Ambrosia artemisiifolia TaxID=4212 RepID=A0AAD5BWX5_AMBAR|nr:hypothetical protein M8C21_008132 [Ambrosia artemisiifolia]